jgi:ribosomal protein S18 acetylase RimI-like enzyme
MGSDPVMRPGIPDDLIAIEAIIAEAYGIYVPRIGQKPRPMEADYGAALSEGVVTVMTIGDAVAGFLILRPAKDHMLLENVAISPLYQGRGLGRQFITHAEVETRAAGLPRIILYTHVKMVENVALYQRFGFRIVAEREEFGLHRVYMEKQM